MKVVAFNGSPNREGNTWHAIGMVTAELEKEGIETEIVHVGNKVGPTSFADSREGAEHERHRLARAAA
jgi:multimeric flavodoxin WrbA